MFPARMLDPRTDGCTASLIVDLERERFSWLINDTFSFLWNAAKVWALKSSLLARRSSCLHGATLLMTKRVSGWETEISLMLETRVELASFDALVFKSFKPLWISTASNDDEWDASSKVDFMLLMVAVFLETTFRPYDAPRRSASTPSKTESWRISMLGN